MKTCVLIALALLLLLVFLRRTTDSMYLSVLRTTSWKSGRKVRQDVTRSFGTFPSYGAVYTGMRQLEAKGFVESRERVLTDRLVREFRLTQSGLDRKNGARGARADDPKTTIQTA